MKRALTVIENGIRAIQVERERHENKPPVKEKEEDEGDGSETP
jgi:hypothetical protein